MAGILTERETIVLMGRLILNVHSGIISKENSLHNIQEDINLYSMMGYMQALYADKLIQMTKSEKAIAENIYNQILEELD